MATHTERETQGDTTERPPARRLPSRGWYGLALAILLVTAGVFAAVVINGRAGAHRAVDRMPRFVGPTPDTGVVLDLDEPGDYVVYYENLGTLKGADDVADRAFDTHRLQVWTTPTRPSMACTVTREDGGETVAVRLLGQTGDRPAEFDVDRDVGVIYDLGDRQGAGIWTFRVAESGRYRFSVAYLPEVYLDAGSVEVPEALTRAEQSQMRFEDVQQHEEQRAQALGRSALAELEPVDVLFAVGPDPTGGSYFNVAGLKGAAALLAFGLTGSTVIALVTLMLRTGSVTERGTMENVRRGVGARGG